MSSYRVPRLLIAVLGLVIFAAALVSIFVTAFPPSLYQILGLATGLVGVLSSRRLRSQRALLMVYTVVLVAGTIAAIPLIRAIWIDQHLILKEHRAEMIDDPRLISRIAPYSGGHDANGFRNDRVPDHADIVTLGDSQTWGYNVERSETWPSMLQKYTSRTVYNMGQIEFGPVQYWVLTGDALQQLSPEIIIVGLYFGNDFYGAYRLAYHYDLYARFRLDQPDDELFLDTIQEVFDVIAYSENTVRYEDDTVGTVFTPVRRLLALDDSDQRIAEGVRITSVLLADIAEQTRTSDVRLIVLLIPTKELVYAERMQAGTSAAYDLVVRRETRLREQVIADLVQNDIEYVDALPVWRAALDHDQAIFPSTSDGHPNAEGHLVLSALVANYLGIGIPSR